jgi:hypothetical protein
VLPNSKSAIYPSTLRGRLSRQSCDRQAVQSARAARACARQVCVCLTAGDAQLTRCQMHLTNVRTRFGDLASRWRRQEGCRNAQGGIASLSSLSRQSHTQSTLSKALQRLRIFAFSPVPLVLTVPDLCALDPPFHCCCVSSSLQPHTRARVRLKSVR